MKRDKLDKAKETDESPPSWGVWIETLILLVSVW